MPNGKYGDHPVSDLLIHGVSKFPPDVADMIRQLDKVAPVAFHNDRSISLQQWSTWEEGKDLEKCRKYLQGMLAKHCSLAHDSSGVGEAG